MPEEVSGNQSLHANKKLLKPVSVWCPPCRGTGMIRRRGNVSWTIEACRRCKTLRRIWVEEGSDLHLESMKMVKGLFPSIKKEKGWLDEKFAGYNKFDKTRKKGTTFRLD